LAIRHDVIIARPIRTGRLFVLPAEQSPRFIKTQNKALFGDLEKPCAELVERFPQRKALFEDYVRRQIEENEFQEGEVECAVLALKK
jgi:hypothetical protein